MGCEICGSEGSLLQANHVDKGRIMVCRDCWTDLYDKNETVGNTGSSSGTSSAPACTSCGI
ncbi:MAG: hypothetical protein ABEJ72_01325 [Candidatus Aenigmatarchaeota archaeon]